MVALGGVHRELSQFVDDSGLDESTNQNEKPDEEEDGRPFDPAEDVFQNPGIAGECQKHEEGSSGQGNGTGFHANLSVKDEHEDGHGQDGKAFLEQDWFFYQAAFVHVHDLSAQFRSCLQILSVDEDDDGDRDGQDDQANISQVA